ncbi:hypothetical protein DXG01_010411, partial [Tephrocybe rancida]
GGFWLVASAETAAVLAAEGFLPSSHRVLDILMPRGSISDLRLTPLSITGMLLCLVGSWIRLQCFRTLREFFTFEITIRDNHKLITSGPYGVVRHPSYTGTMTIFIGLCFWYASRGSWIRESGILHTVVGRACVGAFTAVYVKLVVNLWQRMPEEDRLMKASFGSEWEEWARRGGFWLAAAAETAVILAAEGHPPSANSVLEVLMLKGSISDLRLMPLSIAGALLSVAGCWIRLKCFRTLREFFTFEITVRDNHKLITSGPYGVVRHPAYTGSTTILIGLCCWYASRGSWIRESGTLHTAAGKACVGAFAAVYVKLLVSLLQRMPEEDRLMKASFGSEWEEWARRVPYWLIPGIY